jgi:hypothetical protein
MLIDELRVELPGEQAGNSDLKEVDKRNEAEYERRTAGMAAEEAAAVAVEITDHRKKEETASGPHAKRGGPPERPHP